MTYELDYIVKTETGSTYEFATVDGVRKVRRVEWSHSKNRDGEWVELHVMIPAEPRVGQSMRLVLEPIYEGHTQTVRTTSWVTEIQ